MSLCWSGGIPCKTHEFSDPQKYKIQIQIQIQSFIPPCPEFCS